MERIAFLVEPDDQRKSCMLNPETITIKRTSGIKERECIGGNLSGNNMTDAPLIFTGAGVTLLEMDLLFDVTLPGSSVVSRDVRDLTGRFFELAENTMDNDGYKRPGIIRMVWGKSWNIPGVITDIAERLDYFTRGGVPRRSWLKLRFRRINEESEFMDFLDNLVKIISESAEILELLDTSSPHGVAEAIGALVQASETIILNDRLDAIAENYYHDPSLWRLIALLNGISNPFETLGKRLIQIPPLKELVKLI